MTKDEALKMDVTQAIDFLYSIPIEYSLQPIDHDRFENAVDVLSKALEQPAQEPVAYRFKWDKDLQWHFSEYLAMRDYYDSEPLYTHPAQPCQECENLKHDLDSYMKLAHDYANQKPLSDDEKLAIIRKWGENHRMRGQELIGLCDAIEKAHGIGVER